MTDSATKSGGVKLDLTINLPVMFTVIVTAVGGGMWLAKAEAKADEALKGVASVKEYQTSQSAIVWQELANMRAEVRSDMRDINMKIDQIIWRLGDPPKNLKEWQK